MASLEISEEFLTRIAKDKKVSDGELAALKLALRRSKSKDIAEQLNISQAAARKRLGEVYRKFGIKGRGPGKLASLEKTLEAELQEWAGQALKGSGDIAFPSTITPTAATLPSSGDIWHRMQLEEVPLVQTIPVTESATTYYWNNAPALEAFEGRNHPLTVLKSWLNKPSTTPKLLAICGIGGTGKTYLAHKLAQDVGDDFEKVVWLNVKDGMQAGRSPEHLLRSLKNTLLAPAPTAIPLRRLNRATKPASSTDSTIHAVKESIEQVIERLAAVIAQHRYLIVFDGFEVAFKSWGDMSQDMPSQDFPSPGSSRDAKGKPNRAPTFHVNRRQQASLYKEEFSAYRKLLSAVKQTANGSKLSQTSCVVLTSREKPKEVLSFPEDDIDGKLYVLEGLSDNEAKKMLERFHLQGTSAEYQAFITRYCGHPLALKLAANTVKDVFHGSIRDFLEQDTSVFDDLRGVLKAQFNRLPPTEKEVMYWLAINHQACSYEALQADIVATDHKQNLIHTLRSLERRSLVQINQPQQTVGVSFQLHPIVAEYVRDRFIRSVFSDLIKGNLDLFNAHALMKADAADDLREFQIKKIVRPILERLKNYHKSLNQVDRYLSDRLNEFKGNNPDRLGYAGGNFVNLLVQLSHGALQKKDFSQMTIWQAYLQGAQLRGVNFNQCALNRSVFTEAISDVLSVALQLPTSRPPLLVAGDANGFVHLWHTAGEKQTAWLAHQSWVRATVFVPNRSLLVTGGEDSQLKLWRLPTFGKGASGPVEQVWQQEAKDRIYTVAASCDGKLIASGGDDKITIYRVRTGEIIDRIPRQTADRDRPRISNGVAKSWQHNRVRALAFSPDGQWLASCGDDCTVRLWAVKDILATERSLEPIAELAGHTDLVYAVRFSADSRRLISGGGDEKIIIWEAVEASAASENSSSEDDSSEDDSLEGNSSEDKQNLVWQKSRSLNRVGGSIRALAISPDDRLVAAGGDDATVRVWNLSTLTCIHEFSAQTSRIWSVDFQRQGDRLLLAAGGDKQRLMLWQIEENQTEEKPEARLIRTYRGYTNSLRAVAYLSDRRVIGGGDGGDLTVWDTESGDRTATLPRHQGRIWSVAVDQQNARIASASDDCTIRLWDATNGQCLTTLTGHNSWVRAVAFSKRGRFLASGGDDCTLRIWNPLSGFCLKVLPPASHWIRTVSFSPTNNRYIISGGDDQAVRRWDRKEGTYETFAQHGHRVCSVAYSPDGKFVASGGDNAAVILWDVDNAEVAYRFTQPMLSIKAVAFSPNGRYLAAGGDDQLLYVWDLKAPNPEARCLEFSPQEYTGLAGGIRSIMFSPDSQSVVCGSLDEMIRVGDLRQTDELRASELGSGVLKALIRRDRPYENTEIKGVKGLNDLQRANLMTLGAVDRKTSLLL